MRRILIAKYFVDFAERAALYQLVGLSMPPEAIVREDARLYEAARERGREARFRLTVVPAYNYTCALTRYRLVTIDSGSIVEAAHIHQFADSRNNHPRNGIALSKNAHWMFDEGLWSLDDDYRVIIDRKRFDESGAEELLLSHKATTRILLHADRHYWPDKAPCAEDFVFAEWFESGRGDGSDSKRVSDSIENFNGIAFRAVGRNVVIHKFNDVAPFEPMLRHIARKHYIGV